MSTRGHLLVMKFGGSSMGSAERIKAAARLTTEQHAKRSVVIVVSAMAKVQSQTRHIIQTEDQAGPVPTLGIDATWVASKRFYFDARAQYLSVHVNNLDGSLGFYELDALYRYRPNVSFAVGYADIKAHVASRQASNGALFNFDTKGPEMFFRIAF